MPLRCNMMIFAYSISISRRTSIADRRRRRATESTMHRGYGAGLAGYTVARAPTDRKTRRAVAPPPNPPVRHAERMKEPLPIQLARLICANVARGTKAEPLLSQRLEWFNYSLTKKSRIIITTVVN